MKIKSTSLALLIAAGLLSTTASATDYPVFNLPGAQMSWATGISGNNLVGNYYDSNYDSHAFFYNGTSVTNLSGPTGAETQNVNPYGVSGNTVVGQYFNGVDKTWYGFIYDGTNYTTLNFANNIMPTAISGNKVVGQYYDRGYRGFVYDSGNTTTYNAPGATNTFFTGISGNSIVGYSYDSNYDVYSFIYDGSSYTPINVTGSRFTVALGVSGNTVVGRYFDTDWFMHGFIYDGTSYTTIDFPNQNNTSLIGISGSKILGEYGGGMGPGTSFLLQQAIPEPSTYGLMGIGALGIAFAARRRKSKVA